MKYLTYVLAVVLALVASAAAKEVRLRPREGVFNAMQRVGCDNPKYIDTVLQMNGLSAEDARHLWPGHLLKKIPDDCSGSPPKQDPGAQNAQVRQLEADNAALLGQIQAKDIIIDTLNKVMEGADKTIRSLQTKLLEKDGTIADLNRQLSLRRTIVVAWQYPGMAGMACMGILWGAWWFWFKGRMLIAPLRRRIKHEQTGETEEFTLHSVSPDPNVPDTLRPQYLHRACGELVPDDVLETHAADEGSLRHIRHPLPTSLRRTGSS